MDELEEAMQIAEREWRFSPLLAVLRRRERTRAMDDLERVARRGIEDAYGIERRPARFSAGSLGAAGFEL